MAIARLGKGDLHLLQIQKETAYGGAVEGTASVLGVMTSYKLNEDDETFEIPTAKTTPGARSVRGTTVIMTRDDGFTATVYPDSVTSLQTFLTWAVDGTPFTATAEIKYKTVDKFAGCTVESWTLKSTQYGAPLELDITVKAASVTKAATLATDITTSNLPVRTSAKWDCSVNALDGSIGSATSWELSYSTGITQIPGNVAGLTGIASKNGSEPILGQADYRLTVTCPALVDSVAETYRGGQTNGQYNEMNLTFLVAEGHTITVSGAYVDTDHPTRTQDDYDETLTFIARSVTMS